MVVVDDRSTSVEDDDELFPVNVNRYNERYFVCVIEFFSVDRFDPTLWIQDSYTRPPYCTYSTACCCAFIPGESSILLLRMIILYYDAETL